ncbi:MAG: type I-E CRISPR-associated protein Cas7/Cse4/CasC, partial [Desulfovibrio sp.]|nr:type I-E CRISPR-associated protein Cas7/Cse4/CasC [Desulfovibrio sp.]
EGAHLGGLTPEERQNVVRMFIRATLTAMPAARHNSMHAATLPSFVLAVVREKGHPMKLVNAFEEHVWTRGGLAAASRKKLEEEYDHLKKIWGVEALAECRLPDMPLAHLLDEVVQHVR